MTSIVRRAGVAGWDDEDFDAPVCCLVVADLSHGEDSQISDDFDVYYLLVLGLSIEVPHTYERLGPLILYAEPEAGSKWLAE